MLNQVILVGRLTSDIQVEEKEEGKKVTTITLTIPRSMKNADGEYETDFIPCILWNSVAENTAEYCKKGDILGIKGRLESKDNSITVYAEKVTFLSTKKVD